jgi:transposase InsO family protein
MSPSVIPGASLHRHSSRILPKVGQGYARFDVIVAVETSTLFIFNQIVATFDIPKEIFTDHGSHFQNKMMTELTSNLRLRKEHSSPYYPQANGQVEAVNKSLKTILQQTINSTKSNWNLMLYSAL